MYGAPKGHRTHSGGHFRPFSSQSWPFYGLPPPSMCLSLGIPRVGRQRGLSKTSTRGSPKRNSGGTAQWGKRKRDMSSLSFVVVVVAYFGFNGNDNDNSTPHLTVSPCTTGPNGKRKEDTAYRCRIAAAHLREILRGSRGARQVSL